MWLGFVVWQLVAHLLLVHCELRSSTRRSRGSTDHGTTQSVSLVAKVLFLQRPFFFCLRRPITPSVAEAERVFFFFVCVCALRRPGALFLPAEAGRSVSSCRVRAHLFESWWRPSSSSGWRCVNESAMSDCSRRRLVVAASQGGEAQACRKAEASAPEGALGRSIFSEACSTGEQPKNRFPRTTLAKAITIHLCNVTHQQLV